ncbi:MAG: NfeD family protein [Solirubrobacterales bacterium]
MSIGFLRLAGWMAVAAAGLAQLLASPGRGQSTERFAYSIELTGTIDPATSRWVDSALDDAAEQEATVAIIRLDTPGGLDDSLRDIVRDIIAAPMPVIVYVSPDGARAASAGVYIAQAADVAAMAPQTNIGSATPISIGPGAEDEVLGRKIRNDAAAYVRALASAHGRNPELGERMVRDAANVTAQEALDANFIDAIAGSERRLLAELDGFRVQGPKAQVLDTGGLRIETHDMPLQYEILQILVNPTIAFLLLSLVLLGMTIELFSPGLIFPGTLGLISFLMGLYGTAQLPVTAAGILLLVAAIALFIAEAHFTSGVLGVSGVVALILSGLLLFDTGGGAAEVSVPAVIVTGVLIGGAVLFAIQRVVEARREPVRTGFEEMVGLPGEVRVPLAPEGQVFAQGALWRARTADQAARLGVGDRVRVEAVDGLTLLVSPEPQAEPESEQGEI